MPIRGSPRRIKAIKQWVFFLIFILIVLIDPYLQKYSRILSYCQHGSIQANHYLQCIVQDDTLEKTWQGGRWTCIPSRFETTWILYTEIHQIKTRKRPTITTWYFSAWLLRESREMLSAMAQEGNAKAVRPWIGRVALLGFCLPTTINKWSEVIAKQSRGIFFFFYIK